MPFIFSSLPLVIFAFLIRHPRFPSVLPFLLFALFHLSPAPFLLPLLPSLFAVLLLGIFSMLFSQTPLQRLTLSFHNISLPLVSISLSEPQTDLALEAAVTRVFSQF